MISSEELKPFMGTYFSAALQFLVAATLALPAAHGNSQAGEDPRFGIEIQPTTENGPQFTLTNLSQKTLTAFFVEISSPTESNKPSSMGWDAFLQGKPPLEMGATVSANLPHRVGGPIPDKVEVVAGICEDGETLGRPGRVNLLIISRRMWEDELDQVVSVLERSLKEVWTRVGRANDLAEKLIPSWGPCFSAREQQIG